MQALMLAAGMGKRLGRYTRDNTKCMLKIQGKTLIERAVEALIAEDVYRMIIVIGYKGSALKEFLLNSENPAIKQMDFVFVENAVYSETNNIYSLYLAKDELLKEDTILLESDLIYDSRLISRLIHSEYKNAVLVSKFEQWMDGTMIKKDEYNRIVEFVEKKDFNSREIGKYYKTVNIYKFSSEFSKNNLLPFLEAYIQVYGKNEYYEMVLKIIAHLSRSPLHAIEVSDLAWYEIDNGEDFSIAESIFSTGNEKLQSMQNRYGGYWRFEKMIDYCYLVNPYYPTESLIEKMNLFATKLITQYPSGQNINCINAGLLFNNKVHEKHLCVGNGAAELINILGSLLSGRMLVSESVFNEYRRCFINCHIDTFDMSKNDYRFNLEELLLAAREYDTICIVSPDNPTGAHLAFSEIQAILDVAIQNGTKIIFDESFIDFAEGERRYTLLNDEILVKYPNLFVIKSISKSYGIPGIRLGVLANSNSENISKIKSALPVWNINSFGEYFLQIGHSYSKDYLSACKKIAVERKNFKQELEALGLKVYESEANFLMCDLIDCDSTTVTLKMLDSYKIFIKDLKTKSAFKGKNLIRLAIKNREDNEYFIFALKAILEELR